MNYPKTSGIYIHFPFCASKCGFCDFYSGVFPYHGDYFKSIIQEIQIYKNNGMIHNYQFDTLYFGGGTPSLVTNEDMESFFHFLNSDGLIKNLKEITIEMNPEDVSLEKLKFYKSLGINRISLGVQSLDQYMLSALERRADLKKTIQSITLVAQEFDNYSLDFMYGVPNQELCTELFAFSTFSPPHLSTYALTLYPGTRFYVNKEFYSRLDEEFVKDYEDIHNFFVQLGYEHYEISSFAKPNKRSLHNEHYWNQDYYLGLGAGASGYLGKIRYTNGQLKEYHQLVGQNILPVKEQEEIDEKSFFMDLFILKLRKNEKFYLAEYLKPFSQEILIRLEDFFVDMSTKGYIFYDKSEKSMTPNLQSWVFSDSFTQSVYNILY